VHPISPVHLHLGSSITFKLLSPPSSPISWSSSDPRILEINSQDGSAIARGEGKAEIMLSNNINAASIVYVGRVRYGEVEVPVGEKEVLVNVEERGEVVRTRVRMYI